MKHFIYTLLFCAAACYCNAQKFKPALNLANGTTYYLNSTANSVITQTIAGQENKINLGFAFSMAFKVTGTVDSVYNMEVSYHSLSMTMDMADNSIRFDSKKNDPQDVQSTMVAAMMDKPFNIEMTKSGRVKSVTNLDKIFSTFDTFTQVDAARREQVKTMLMQSFGPNAFKGNIEVGTAIFPATPVAKEGKWTVNTILESPVKSAVSVNYQLVDVVAGLYIIHGDGTITCDKNAAPADVSGMPVKYNLNGSLVSDIRVDKATGWISEIKLKQVVMGDMQILDNPKVPGGMTVPLSFNTDAITTNK